MIEKMTNKNEDTEFTGFYTFKSIVIDNKV